MKRISKLPFGYRKIYEIDMQKDKKMFWLIQLLGTLIMVVMAVPAHFYVPITSLFDTSVRSEIYVIRLGVLIISLILYLILHEAVHGIAMKMCGTKKVRYGFTGAYAFAASDDYYAKGPYLFIALAPVVLWGVVLAVITYLVPTEWFWVIYFIQICNISGAVGDLFVTFRFARFPKDILVRDYGVGMVVYGKKERSGFWSFFGSKK